MLNFLEFPEAVLLDGHVDGHSFHALNLESKYSYGTLWAFDQLSTNLENGLFCIIKGSQIFRIMVGTQPFLKIITIELGIS